MHSGRSRNQIICRKVRKHRQDRYFSTEEELSLEEILQEDEDDYHFMLIEDWEQEEYEEIQRQQEEEAYWMTEKELRWEEDQYLDDYYSKYDDMDYDPSPPPNLTRKNAPWAI